MYNENYKYAINGDIHLTDVRSFKEQIINNTGLNAIFPLWKKSTKDLAHQFIDLGYKAIVVSVDLNVLDKSFGGRVFDKDFLNDLPQHVDPCGENGEFHTFCYEGPLFSYPIPFKKLYTRAITMHQQGIAGQVPQYFVQYIE